MNKQVAITDSFIKSMLKLSDQEKKLVFNTVKQISENPKAPSLHIHGIDREKCDKKFVSARVNLDLRIIMVRRGEVYTLLYVNHHDAAYDWCEGKYLSKTGFGSEYIYDENLASDRMDSFSKSQITSDYLSYGKEKGLFDDANIKLKQFVKLGIQEIHAKNLLKMDNESQLLEYIDIFPEELQEALMDLATNTKSFDTVYNDLFSEGDDNVEVREKQRFYLTDNLEELAELMDNEEFEKWTLFLHPSQKKLVHLNCNGPMLIEGGPGTGKTIVGIHRAVRLSNDIYRAKDNKKILFCTFSKKLVNNINKKIERLCKIKNVQNNIDCMTVDAYIAKLLGKKALNVDTEKIENILKTVYKKNNWEYSYEFYIQEYYEIVEKNHIETLEEYIAIRRKGLGKNLSKSSRINVWKFFEYVLKEKNESNAYSFVDRAHQLKKLIERNEIDKIYDSVIVDEAQDLESVKLNVICSSMKNVRNSACILSDKNQRIFRLNTWLKDAEVNIVGRTYYLRVNYRTTKQINDYARSLFLEFDNTSLADKEYISIMSGDNPKILKCKTESEENHVIIDCLKEYLKDYSSEEICVLAPTYNRLKTIKAVCEYEGVETSLLMTGEEQNDNKAITLCTTSGVKGLEYSVIIIVSFNMIGTQRQNYGCAPEASLNYDKLVECEKYVSITRARDKVLITFLGD